MFEKLSIGQAIESSVVAISGDSVFIDLNAKSEGVIDASEFLDDDGNITIKEGDKIKAFFVGESEGQMKFATKIKGDNADAAMLKNAFENHITVEGIVEKEIKGGFEVKIGKVHAFCPFSQIDAKRHDENADFVGKTLSFVIREYKENGKNIIVSHRAVLDDEKKNAVAVLSEKIKVGDEVLGTVVSLQKFGAFVDIGGFQALLPITEIAFERVNKASDFLEVGQKITVKVISASWENEKVSVSLKEMQNDPWESVDEKFFQGEKIDGVISRISDFGLFITLDKGIDGLTHISTLRGVEKNTNLKKKFKVGDKMSVVIKDIDAKNKRISLVPSTSVDEDNSASKFIKSQTIDSGEMYNPFADLLKK